MDREPASTEQAPDSIEDRFAVDEVKWREALAPLLLQRTRLILWLMFFMGTGFTVVELMTADRLGPHTVVKGCGLSSMIAGLIMLHRPWAVRYARPLAIVIVTLGYIATALSGALSPSREYLTSSTLFLGAALTTATMLPWGALPQLFTVTVGAIVLLASIIWADGTLRVALTDPEVAVGLAFAGSVAVAKEMQRSRLAALHLEQLHRGAEERVRQLNSTLEQRVLDRTNELQRANARLEVEIDEKAKIALALSESRKRLVDVVDHSTAMISLKDTEGRYLLVNREFERVLGVRRQFVIDRDDQQVFDASRREKERQRDQQVLSTDLPQSYDDELLSIAGPRAYITVKFPLHGRDGHPYGVGTLSTDVTRLRSAEEQSRQHENELAHVQRLHLVNQMAAVLAHEIHQPLGAIANYSQGGVYRLRAGNGRLGELLPVLEKIAAEALRAGDILRGVRRLMAKQTAPAEPVDVNAAVSGAARMLEFQARRNSVELRVSTTPTRPFVIADKTQIEQVLVNLVLNGIDAVSAAEERRVDVDTEVEGGSVAIIVSDNGPGVDAEAAAKLFTPFFTTKAHGLGMGLAISRSIVEAHGGRLSLGVSSHGGATFRVELPLAAPLEAPNEGAPRAVHVHSKTEPADAPPAMRRQKG